MDKNVTISRAFGLFRKNKSTQRFSFRQFGKNNKGKWKTLCLFYYTIVESFIILVFLVRYIRKTTYFIKNMFKQQAAHPGRE